MSYSPNVLQELAGVTEVEAGEQQHRTSEGPERGRVVKRMHGNDDNVALETNFTRETQNSGTITTSTCTLECSAPNI